jgi:hypothetical protein
VKPFLKRGRRAGAEAEMMAAFISICERRRIWLGMSWNVWGVAAGETYEDVVVWGVIGYGVDPKRIKANN